MKQYPFSCLALMLGLGLAPAATTVQPQFSNEDPVVAPPALAPSINARSFINWSIFDVTSTLAYQMMGTQFITNETSGQMSFSPGTTFQNLSGTRVSPAGWFVNKGDISVTRMLTVNATNIVNAGTLRGDATASINLNGKNLDLSRGLIQVGQAGTCYFPSTGFNPFSPASGITDLYWGAGSNNVVTGAGNPMRLDGFGGFDGNFTLPFPWSPTHQVQQLSGTGFGQSFASIPNCGGNFQAYVHVTDSGNASNSLVIQAVFVATNSLAASNMAVDVRFEDTFAPGFGFVTTPLVQFSTSEFDRTSEQYVTNYLTFVDATASYSTNLVSARNARSPTRRPISYDIFSAQACNWDFASPANSQYSDNLFYDPTVMATNRVNILYAAYSAQVGQVTVATNGSIFFDTTTRTTDPSNFTGRVTIAADQANFQLSRIKAENYARVSANNILSNSMPQIDSPNIALRLGTKAPELVISNLAPTSVRRVGGRLQAWSGVWMNNVTNQDGTVRSARFHVLIVDNCLTGDTPVRFQEFTAQATNICIVNVVASAKSMQLIATNLTVKGGLSIGAGASLGGTNLVNVRNLTNYGFIDVAVAGNFGGDRKFPYDSIINRSRIQGASLNFRARNFRSVGGYPAGFDRAYLTGTNGTLTIDSTNAVLRDTSLASSAELRVYSRDLTMTNTTLFSGGGTNGAGNLITAPITFAATNSIDDGGPTGNNRWITTAGISARTLPRRGDLLGTEVTSYGAPFAQVVHTWPASNFQATARGFSNNLALGRLTLDGGSNSLFSFAGTAAKRAIYVEYLELLNNATNIYRGSVRIDPNFTVYFANANVPPEKLDGAVAGRLRWVPGYVGPRSSTLVTYPDGNAYPVNSGMLTASDLDSDGDGKANSEDPYPVFIPQSIALSIQQIETNRVSLSWYAPLFSTNVLICYTNALKTNNLKVVSSFVNTSVDETERIVREESLRLTPNSPPCYYRVQVTPRNR